MIESAVISIYLDEYNLKKNSDIFLFMSEYFYQSSNGEYSLDFKNTEISSEIKIWKDLCKFMKKNMKLIKLIRNDFGYIDFKVMINYSKRNVHVPYEFLKIVEGLRSTIEVNTIN